jgi:hypothetical protein
MEWMYISIHIEYYKRIQKTEPDFIIHEVLLLPYVADYLFYYTALFLCTIPKRLAAKRVSLSKRKQKKG